MNPRNSRLTPRSQTALVNRGSAATPLPPASSSPPVHAPNAALLIDFDNVTIGIQSDLGKELRSFLSSDIIKGKVCVQRAYADWRRYPQYVVPLTEASVDLIWAPAYGSSKKNATDIRLAIDALELVFVRPEIGTFILFSGDSDFSSLVLKLKEYGKHVIGVGIRQSSSELLVQNCDEYYSYTAVVGLVKASEEEPAAKWDPWELVKESVARMKRNGDVMRSDRLKQVMQEIDGTFDEKDLGMAKFSRFVQEAAGRSLLSVTKLENGQLEIDVPAGAGTAAVERPKGVAAGGTNGEPVADEAGRPPRRGRRGRGGRGRGDRQHREGQQDAADSRPVSVESSAQLDLAPSDAHVPAMPAHAGHATEPVSHAGSAATHAGADGDLLGRSGERLTRAEAFDIVRRAVESLTDGDTPVRASAVRARAHELLGRDSESLNERMFVRILKDAHDSGIVDLRRRGDDFDVARAAEPEPVAVQSNRAEAAATPAPAPVTAGPRIGMGPRGSHSRGRGVLPPGLLTIGVVEEPAASAPAAVAEEVASANHAELAPAPTPKGRKTAAKRGAAKASTPATSKDDGEAEGAAKAKPRRAPRAKKSRSGPAA